MYGGQAVIEGVMIRAKTCCTVAVRRPNGKIVDELSLKPICEDLKKKMNSNIKLITKNINDIDPKHLFTDTDEKILMLENIRFYEGEEKNDYEFAKKISKLGDIFVNDAFSVSHRNHVSITGVTNFLPSVDFCASDLGKKSSP